MQVDCTGYAYLGAPRLAEFVFADGRLSHVWVLVEDSELPALQNAFETAYDAARVDTPAFAAFYKARGAVRRDVPEALFHAEHVAPMFEALVLQPAMRLGVVRRLGPRLRIGQEAAVKIEVAAGHIAGR